MIQNIATQYKIQGKVIIHGYQQGGDPSQLGRILDQKCGDHFCAASCSMTNMSSCVSAVDGLLNYAINIYPSQLSITENRGLSWSFQWLEPNLSSLFLVGSLEGAGAIF